MKKKDAKIELKNIKIFADGADLQGMVSAAKSPQIKGLTTNPTLMRKAGVTDYRAFARDVLAQITDKPISFEVFADDAPSMKRQALEIASWGENVYVKIPVTNTEGTSMAPLISELSGMGVKLNVTAVFDLEQVHEVAYALREGGSPGIVSVFAGRIADSGRDPIPYMRAALAICRAAGPGIELLWASPREVLNLVQADEIGCDIITVTSDILKKLPSLGTELRKFSLDTVRMFYEDATSAGYSLD